MGPIQSATRRRPSGRLLFSIFALLGVISSFGVVGAQMAQSPHTGNVFTPVTPLRVLDTRTGTGARAGRWVRRC